MSRARIFQFKKISNRERIRRADDAVRQAKSLRKLFIAVLAQKGGEITITAGTLAQVTDDMDFEMKPNPKQEGEFLLRVISGGAEANG